MCVGKTILAALVCTAAWCQQEPSTDIGRKATPADLAISCTVDPAARTAEVRVVNLANAKLYFQYQPSGKEAWLNYEVVIASPAGKPVPKPHPKKSTNTGLIVLGGSRMAAILEPHEERTENFSLSRLAEIPTEGGTFRVRIGRGLFTLWDDPFKFDPAQILWCNAATVTFPPLK